MSQVETTKCKKRLQKLILGFFLGHPITQIWNAENIWQLKLEFRDSQGYQFEYNFQDILNLKNPNVQIYFCLNYEYSCLQRDKK